MRHAVLLTAGAEHDLEAIHDYIAEVESKPSANRVLDRLLKVTDSLSRFPERGSVPRELGALGIREYRQVFFKPYRLIYRVVGRDVVIVLIADGRREMLSLLERRLLVPLAAR
jgi:toxin ParE1/3/4